MLKKIFCIALLLYAFDSRSQNIGIGTNTPNTTALLHLDVGASTTKGLLVSSTAMSGVGGSVPNLGGSARMMFYPARAAFRAGVVTADQWDNVNVGGASAAIGTNAIAYGYGCTAIGYYPQALGDYSTALGFQTKATNQYSFAMGLNTLASGWASTTMGCYVSTSGFNGAFAIGDNSTTTVMESFVDNGFRARFAGGYRLLTNSAANIGVVLLASGNAWSAISDSRLKENFLPVDGESFLQKIARMSLTSWNYIGQDVNTLRHYGPMAQDFYKAFGQDNLGTIGCDTLINQQDFLGVNLIAIQALEKRTQQIEVMQQQIADLQKANSILQEQLNKLLQEKIRKVY